MKLQPKVLALIISGMFVSGATFAQTAAVDDKKDEKKTTELGTISITGEGDKLGAGTIIQEDGAKARSTATRASIDKQRSTANPFQILQQLPGVNTSSQDATGLFGGALRVRGFNSDQMGFTVDGAPVNDSGNFAVFPQEYVDQENLCEVFVTQGSADNEAPHVGATGGNIGIVSCDPLDKRRVRGQLTGGQLNLSKYFARYDTGLIGKFKAFLSFSHAQSSKFKGVGGANRDHFDFKANYDLGRGSRLQLTALYNNAINNNLRTLSLADIAVPGAGGYFRDYATVYTPDPTPGPGAQAAPARPDGFWTVPINPFRNAIITAKGWFAINPTTRVDIEPYFWYGFGNGNGPAPTVVTLREGTGTSSLRGGIGDINGDGDKLDTVSVFRSSVTRTYRPGATVKLNWQAGNNRIVAGYWFERARHIQTQPANKLNTDGSVTDYWLQNESQYIRRADGSFYQGRDQRTLSTADSFFVSDTISLLNDKLVLIPAVKTPRLKRDFTNYANDGASPAGVDYTNSQTDKSTNPSFGARYSITDAHQVFGSMTKGSRTTNNFNLSAAAQVSGVLIFPKVKQEKSVTTDVGYRYLSDVVTFSGTAYMTKFKDRISRAFDQDLARTVDTNVGDADIKGFELEAGTRPFMGFSLYGSYTYTKSEFKNNIFTGTTPTATLTQLLPVAGKEFPDTPNRLAAVTLQYVNGPFLASVNNKYTGRRFSSLMNDQALGGFALTDVSLGYRLPNTDWVKNVTLRFNMSNVTDRQYLVLSTGSGSSFVNNTVAIPGITAGTGNVFYYVGAPRFSSVSVSMDF